MFDTIILTFTLLVMIRSIVNALFPGAMDVPVEQDGTRGGEGANNASTGTAMDQPTGPAASEAFPARRSNATARVNQAVRFHLIPPPIPHPLHVCQVKVLLRRLLPEETIVLSILRLPSAGLFPLVREIQPEERKVHQEYVTDRTRFPLPGSSISVWDTGEKAEVHEHWHYLVTSGLWGEVDRSVLNQMVLHEESEKAWEEKWGDKGEVVKEEEERMHIVVEEQRATEMQEAARRSGAGGSSGTSTQPKHRTTDQPRLFAQTESFEEADSQILPSPSADALPPPLLSQPTGPVQDESQAIDQDGSARTGFSPWKIKQVEIELRSHDQGWSDTPQFRGTYENSYTWFDVGIKRDGEILAGWYTIQRNKHATKSATTHVIPIDLNVPLWRQARRGDQIVVMAKARFPGWANHVQKAEVRVTYGF